MNIRDRGITKNLKTNKYVYDMTFEEIKQFTAADLEAMARQGALDTIKYLAIRGYAPSLWENDYEKMSFTELEYYLDSAIRKRIRQLNENFTKDMYKSTV